MRRNRKENEHLSAFADWIKLSRELNQNTVNSYVSNVGILLRDINGDYSIENMHKVFNSIKEVNRSPVRCSWEAYRGYLLDSARIAPEGVSVFIPPALPTDDPTLSNEAREAIREACGRNVIATTQRPNQSRIPYVSLPVMVRLRYDVNKTALAKMFPDCVVFNYERGGKNVIIPIYKRHVIPVARWAYPDKRLFVGPNKDIFNDDEVSVNHLFLPAAPNSSMSISIPQLKRIIQ